MVLRPLLFSGRNNPELVLEAEDCQGLLTALKDATLLDIDPAPLPPLGYGGVELVIGNETFWVFEGAIYTDEGNRSDTDRAFERRLLQFAISRTDSEIADHLESILQSLK